MGVLEDLGWDDGFARDFAVHAEAGLVAARVIVQHSDLHRVQGEAVDGLAEISGRVKHDARTRAEMPVIGDWVAVRLQTGQDRPVIQAVLPRRSRFIRRAAGDENEEQVVASNVDTVFLVSGLDLDFNPRRLERYLLLARESGAEPVLVLNKMDLRPDLDEAIAEVRLVARDVPVLAISTKRGIGLEQLAPYLQPRRTVAFLGSSGVGKSTLINRLLGTETQKTAEVRESDSRGRHTTTRRELMRLPEGALVIDTPGMREIQLWEAPGAISETFKDVESFAGGCRFRDCRHDAEPGCAVRRAAETGALPADRLESYHRLRGEVARIAEMADKRVMSERNREVRSIHRAARKHKPRSS